MSDILLITGIILVIASPWYLRNWAWTGNPFYPFLFGGKYWDSFRANFQTAAGTGIGYNPISLFALPLTVTLGYRDATYFDGRFGPLYLILFPVVAWVLWSSRKYHGEQKDALVITSTFALISILFWTYGVIQTNRLWQARLLWPGLIPLTLPMTAGILEVKKLDTPKFRLSFIFSAIVAITVFVFLLDFGLLVWHRNPLAFALGLESRESYASRQQPEYTAAVNMVNKTPSNAYIYLVYEPRSYGMERRVQPDPINDNLPHDFYLYSTNSDLISVWQKLGYTHILLANKAIYAYDSDLKEQVIRGFYTRLEELEKLLTEIGRTEDGSYILYEVPAK